MTLFLSHTLFHFILAHLLLRSLATPSWGFLYIRLSSCVLAPAPPALALCSEGARERARGRADMFAYRLFASSFTRVFRMCFLLSLSSL